MEVEVLKILYVGADTTACGAGYSMIKLIDELQKNNIEVIPVVRHGNTEKLLCEKQQQHYVVDAYSWVLSKKTSKIKFYIHKYLKKFLNIRCYFQYKKIIKKENPDIVHINALTTYVIALAALSMNKPIVWHIREMIEEGLNGKFWNENFAYKLMNKADAFIAVSECVKLKYSGMVSPSKIHRIYNGIDKELFLDERHIIFDKSEIIITMAGKIIQNKGQLDCLEKLVPILLANKNIVLQFAGVGSQEYIEQILDLKNRSGICDNQIRFLGFVKEMNKLWSETDIAIVYSKFEAFGRVTVEAKMAGALVVGYDSGGTSELINDGVDGFLFNDNTKNLTKIILEILADKDKSQKVASKGRDCAMQIFTAENNAKDICELYNKLLHEKNEI